MQMQTRPDVEVGRVTTTATGTDFITNTITAEDRRNVICQQL